MPAKGPPRSPGRPRSESAGPAILEATRQLVRQHGYEAVTTELIAAAAGTGKQTIYRRWPSKAELVLAAFVEHAEQSIDRELRRRRPVSGKIIVTFLNRLFRALAETGEAVRSLMAHAQLDAGFRRLFYERLIAPRRQALRRVLEEAAAENEIPPEADLELLVTVVYGAMWYRLLLDEPLDRRFADRLANLLRSSASRVSNIR
jgi:AcrR family transcriptional regulator